MFSIEGKKTAALFAAFLFVASAVAVIGASGHEKFDRSALDRGSTGRAVFWGVGFLVNTAFISSNIMSMFGGCPDLPLDARLWKRLTGSEWTGIDVPYMIAEVIFALFCGYKTCRNWPRKSKLRKELEKQETEKRKLEAEKEMIEAIKQKKQENAKLRQKLSRTR